MTTTDHIIPRPNKYMSVERTAELNFIEGHAFAWVDCNNRIIQNSGATAAKKPAPQNLLMYHPAEYS